ncbi:MAG: hypothetical protein ACK5JR_09345 [Tropicimonas sp.]|uniref:hypothetical protein n=1 Tax=Tropicimonas sp. TaxID=2067044 RepID=UPI003A8BB333
MIEPGNPGQSVGQQCQLVVDLALMRQIDEQFLEIPFFGGRQMTWHPRNEGRLVNEKRRSAYR